uniref:Apple domain-containing protein n=1 Tax=Panagrellus redivivus TaxID=6233 RepID=A0A7E4VY43_PANRE
MVEFLSLFGYSLVASELMTYNETPEPKECGAYCVNAGTTECIAFAIYDNDCILFTTVQNYAIKVDECRFFLRDDFAMTVNGRNLTGIDAKIQNNCM